MASDFDRDNSIDALLRSARRDPANANGAGAGPACLDAETLGAWADGGLEADRVRLIEAHVADCARCQAISAAFFSLDEAVAASAPKVLPFRRNRAMYWMPLAAGTIAATLVIWIGVRDKNAVTSQTEAVVADARAAETPASAADQARPQDKQGQQGTSAAPAPQGTAAAPADAKLLQQKVPAPVELRADRMNKEATTANRSRQVAAEPVASPTPARVAAEPVASPAAKALAPPPPAPLPVAPPAVATLPPPPAVAPPPPVATTASGVGAGVAGGVAGGAAGGVRQSSLVMRESVEPRVISEFSSVLAQASTISGLPPTGAMAGGVAGGGAGRGGRGGGGGGGGGRGAPVAMDAAKPMAPPFYWRILSSDVIERSVDRLTWEAIAVDPPGRGLTGGAAPSATVCWIIGRAGLVLLTTDGKEFTRLTQPAPADLISITAQDALRATVTTTGGQSFTTSDGGKSWK